MNPSLIGSDALDILSRITGRKLSATVLSPVLLFLAALISVLMGVILADKTVAAAEERRLYNTVNGFLPPDGEIRQLTLLMMEGIEEQKIFLNPQDILTLTAPFSLSEKLLLIAFGYQMSAADGEIDFREKMYLQSTANRLGINFEHLAVLESAFAERTNGNAAALVEVKTLLAPHQFESLDSVFVQAAYDILAALPGQ